MPSVKVSLAVSLKRMAVVMEPQVRKELQRMRSDMIEDMAHDLSDRVVHDVFGKQQTPEGKAWKSLSEISRKLRAKGSTPGGKGGGVCKPSPARRYARGSKAGVGPTNAFIRSFQIGGKGNHFKRTSKGYEFGSSLEKNGHSVVISFQSTYRIPRSSPATAVERGLRQKAKQTIGKKLKKELNKRAREMSAKRRGAVGNTAACIRRWMGANIGVHAPAPGRHLAHPGRKVLGLPRKWLKRQLAIMERYSQRALEVAVIDANKLAGARISGQARKLERRISEVG